MSRAASSKELFAGVFSRHAEAYNARHAAIRLSGGSPSRELLLDRLGLHGDELVLDLCCGPGNLGVELLARRPAVRLVGADLAAGMLAIAASTLPDCAFVLADAECLPFRDAAFDAIACGHGLQFCPDLRAVLADARRVLAPGSVFAASVPHHQMGALIQVMEAALDPWLPPFPATADRERTLALLADPAALRQAALQAGFAHVEVTEVATETVWQSAREMVEHALGWWTCAVRLEDKSDAERREILEHGVEALEAAHGPGRITVHAGDLVLSARA